MIQGVDSEFNFLPEGGLDENQSSTMYVNNEASVINTEPISIVRPSNITKNITDSHNISSDEGGLSLIGLEVLSYLEEGKRETIAGKRKIDVGSHEEDPYRKAQKVFAQASKVAGDASSPFDVDSALDIHEFPFVNELKDATDCHWVVAHVTLPSWKQYLREISIKQLCNIYDNAYMHQAVLDNVLNGRTRELIFALHKARASCDTMREREIKKDKAYAELEKKFRSMASTEVDSFRRDRAVVVSRVISNAAMKLIQSDEIDVLIARLVKASIIYGRCTIFKEVSELKSPFILEDMPSYRPSSKEEYD
uniref:Uncharacterized protein n=1 Tax=Tanacetum cinerariifolium TaxID=118510 RepID=A0A6L2L763_TANCI|nr:hypothetical protein [Tanacetum cinerariifolium]